MMDNIYIYSNYTLLVTAVILGIVRCYKKGYHHFFDTAFVFVFTGLIFECLFITLTTRKPPHNVPIDVILYKTYYFLFPMVIAVSVLARLFKKPLIPIAIYLLIVGIIYLGIKQFDAQEITLILTLSLLAAKTIQSMHKGGIKISNVIDMFIFMHLYINLFTNLISQKYEMWQNSKYLFIPSIIFQIVVVTNYFLINVKFRRSITH